MAKNRHSLNPTENIADHHIAAIAAAVEKSRRPSTNRAYAKAWRRFETWATRERLEPFPASPVAVAAYLTHRAAAGLSMSSLAMDRKAISHRHRVSGYPTPTAAEEVRQTYAGLRNQLAEEGRGEPHQARGLTAAALDVIRRTAHRPRTGTTGRTESPARARRRGDVDIAMATVMRDALLRRSEAAALRWRAVTFMANGSARVTVRRSKTSAAPVVLYVGMEAASALRKIRPCDPGSDERVFRLKSGRAISNRIAAMAREAGLGEGFSGHSPRVGMAQDLTAAGVGLAAIMVAGRWKSERMPAYYSRTEDLERGAVARFYGNGKGGAGG